jgi:hypothetical protein
MQLLGGHHEVAQQAQVEVVRHVPEHLRSSD